MKKRGVLLAISLFCTEECRRGKREQVVSCDIAECRLFPFRFGFDLAPSGSLNEVFRKLNRPLGKCKRIASAGGLDDGGQKKG
jgi:hypothetical protein